MTVSWSPNGLWGHTDVYLPRSLHREETRDRIEARVKELLAETGDWPVVIGCPDGAREVGSDMLLWFVEFRIGDRDQETRWRDMPSQIHRGRR